MKDPASSKTVLLCILCNIKKNNLQDTQVD